jgi:hypothetical protein
MTTPNEVTSEEKDSALEDDKSSTPTTDGAGGGDEFQLTIKKLEMPVRPRGVLAD